MACRVSGVPRLLASLRIAAVTGFLTVEGGTCCTATGALADTGTTAAAGTGTGPSTADGADDGAGASDGTDGAVVAHGVDATASVGFVTSTLFFLKSACLSLSTHLKHAIDFFSWYDNALIRIFVSAKQL